MTKTRIAALAGSTLLVALLAGCAGTAGDSASSSGSADCPPVTLAGLDDDSHRAAFYALENDLVTSEQIPAVEVNYVTIPAAIQATSSGQFDYVMTSLPGLVNARAGGLDLRAVAYSLAHSGAGLALYVSKDSDIQTPADLVGKRVSIASFGSTATTESQIVFTEQYGLNAALEGGDITWVELDPPTALNALKQGDIDAAILWHQGGWLASNDNELRKAAQLDVEYRDLADGNWPIGAAFVAQGEFVDAHPECVAAFQKMLADSVAYAQDNHEDLAQQIADQTGVNPDFINFWWQPDHYQFGGVLDETWLGYAQSFYDLAYQNGFLPSKVDTTEFSVTPAS